METQAHSWQRAPVISEGCWLTAGRYQSWQDEGAQRIWMKQQQNGFASPSLSFPLRTAEREWLRKNVSAYSRRHCIIYTDEHKQSWTNCLKHKMWFLCTHPSMCLHTHCFPSLSQKKKKKRKSSLPLHHWAHFTQFQTGRVKIRRASVKCRMWRNLCIYWFWDSKTENYCLG